MNALNTVLLAASTLLCLLYALSHALRRPDRLSAEVSGRDYYILLALITFIAVAVRVYRFGSVPGGFNQDGAMAAVDAKALADYGTDRLGMRWPVHLTAWGYGQMSALLSYMMAPLIKLFGLNAVTARLPLLLASLSGLAFLFLFSKDVFGKNTALVIFFFAAIAPWHTLQSRWALDCNLLPHFFMGGVYFLNRGMERKRINITISMVFFGLCMYCYGVALYTVPVFLLTAAIYLLVKKKLGWGRLFASLGVWLVVAWPFLAVMAINYFKLNTVETPLFTLPYFKNSVRASDILLFSDDIAAQLAANIKSLINVAILQKQDLIWNEVSGYGAVYLFSMPFAVIGLIELLKNLKRNSGCVLLLLFTVTGVFAGLMTNGVNVNRVNLIFYPIIFLCGVGLWQLMQFAGKLKWLFPAVYLAAFTVFCATYFTSYAETVANAFYAEFGEAVTAIKDEDADKMYITADSQSIGSYHVSEILTLFYHQIDAKYYQGEMDAGEIPFDEKYVFKSICDIDVDPTEDAVYVVTAADLRYFDPQLFTTESFDSYYVVRPVGQ